MVAKKTTLSERWASDDGYTMERSHLCQRCKHFKGDTACTVYGTIPPLIASGKELCTKAVLV